jgi:phospholipid/cholesterol/gamma-HCH transport system substrate-binding protein
MMPRRRVIGLFTAAGALALLALLFHPPALPWVQTMHLRLEATSFGELNPRAGVELGGVKVGTVDGLELRGGRPLIDISVDPAYADLLHDDASAIIRPHGLLGPRYVELEGGSGGRMVDGATIPSSRVHVATDVDMVLNALQPDVRQSLQTLIVELGTAGDGRGQDVNATLKSLGGATDDLAAVTATLRRRDQDLSGSVVAAERLNGDVQSAPLSAQIQDTDRVLSGLVQVNTSIGHGIDHTATTLQALDVVLDGNSENLSRTLDQAPATVTRLRAVLASATGLVTGVNPTVPSLMTAIVETESSFSGSDANGHFVRVMSLSGTCTAGLNAGCSAPTAMSPARSEEGGSQPGSRLSDQELMRLFLGDH